VLGLAFLQAQSVTTAVRFSTNIAATTFQQ